MRLSRGRKGVELTFNTVVIAVLVLLVLLILGYILIKGLGTANNSMSCEANGGSCDNGNGKGGCQEDWYPKPWQCKTGVCCTNKFL